MSSRLRVRPRADLAVCVAMATAAILPGPAQALPAKAAPQFEQRVIFRASQDPGYACFRIPSIVQTTRGTLLAFAEGRVRTCGDAGDIDIVLKRSTDGGRTWGPLQVVSEGAGDTHGNPAPIVDRTTGRILLPQTHNPASADGTSCAVPCARRPHLQYSDDDGSTWTRPRDLSAQIKPPHWNSWYATGPVHGIQLTRGSHPGRLVFSVNTETWNGSRVTANHAALISSDDGGNTWRRRATDSWLIATDGTFRQKPSEVTLTEHTDGTILVSGREQDGTDLGHRAQTFSRDGGDSFATRFRSLPDLYTPQVQGATLQLGNRILLSCPGDPDRRRTMMIRSSYDGGATWESVDRGTVVTQDWSGYSDMVHIGGGVVGLMYEGGTVDARDEIRFARFNEEWLTPRRGPDPTTADNAPSAQRASVLGGASPTVGVFGGALAFDGNDDAVRLPFRTQLPLGTQNFTASLWFRYTSRTGEQPLLWMGGIGGSQPQIWLRGEPASNRVRALMTVRSGATVVRSASVSTTAAHNDGRWHHLALRRGGGRLTLFIDGSPISTADVAGSVSRNSPFGVHIGQRMDSRAFFTGAIDEVRLWNRALTDAELTRVRQTNTGPSSNTVVWLPMSQVTAGG
ncbi:laminin G [Streptomyces cyaneochromogenes]|uniref:exo-alpha-sialidase n=1 Tax=Streptomyces cyaneochromogenes TaxID=2496836 RepID=A0A3S5HT78_9ACTN|nr:sialidase family protein [Streptomyces cyaneochromogenes]AZQ32299.1 laminin G [Streptomyces cyaneochromogenes]